MSQALIDQVHHLNHLLESLQSDLSQVDHASFNRAPKPGKWSAAQITHHVMRSESLSLKYCQKKLSFNPVLKRSGLMSELREAAVRYYLQSPLRFPAPKGLGTDYLPPEDSIEHVFQQWHAQRQQLEEFMRQLPQQYWDKQIYKHPLVGRLSLKGMLSFFQAHFLHHQKQVFKAVNSKA